MPSIQGLLQFDTLIFPSESLTTRSAEACAWEVARYIQSFSNWPQSIMHSVQSCDDVVFKPKQFDHYEARWNTGSWLQP